MNFLKVKDKFLIEQGKYINLVNLKEKKVNKIKELEELHEKLDKVRLLYLKIGKVQREKIIKDIEMIVSKALQFIRQEEVYFEIKENQTRGRIELDFLIKTIRDGKIDITPIKDSRGDGVSDIVDLALNIATAELVNLEGPLVLDEPVKQISENMLLNTGEFLQEIAHSLNRQVILITHHKEFKDIGDKKFNVCLNGNKSIVEEV